MSHTCDVRSGVLVDTSPKGLGNMRNMILKLIRKNLWSPANQLNSGKEVPVEINSFRKTLYNSPSDEFVIELNYFDIINHIGMPYPTLRGCYVPDDGKIFLVKGRWCLETMIHEILHSCSRPVIESELNRYDELFDGITEFLTGYILYKEFGNCYNHCFTQENKDCSITYRDYTKLWSGFCNFVSLQNIIGLYFPNANNWDDEVDNFIEKIKNLGFTDFRNPFGLAGGPSVIRFETICAKVFGENFQRICNDKENYMNYDTVIDT